MPNQLNYKTKSGWSIKRKVTKIPIKRKVWKIMILGKGGAGCIVESKKPITLKEARLKARKITRKWLVPKSKGGYF